MPGRGGQAVVTPEVNGRALASRPLARPFTGGAPWRAGPRSLPGLHRLRRHRFGLYRLRRHRFGTHGPGLGYPGLPRLRPCSGQLSARLLVPGLSGTGPSRLTRIATDVAGLGLADTGLPAFGLGNPGPAGGGLHCVRLAASGLAARGRPLLGANDIGTGIGLHSLGFGGTGLTRTRPSSGLLRAGLVRAGPHGTWPGGTGLRGTGFAGTGRLSLRASAEQGRRFLLTGAGLVLRRNALVPRAAVARSLTGRRVIAVARGRRGGHRLLPLVGWLLRPARERYDARLLDSCQMDGSGWLTVLPGSGWAVRRGVVRISSIAASSLVVNG